jgi:hypothetical protein
MTRKRDFSYGLEHGKVTRIGASETKRFLAVGRIPSGSKDRSLSVGAISTIAKAYDWPKKHTPIKNRK